MPSCLTSQCWCHILSRAQGLVSSPSSLLPRLPRGQGLESLALNLSLGTVSGTPPECTSQLFLKTRKEKEERENSLLQSLQQPQLREQRLGRNKGFPQTRQIKGLAYVVTGNQPQCFVTDPLEADRPLFLLRLFFGGTGRVGDTLPTPTPGWAAYSHRL